jgi:putative restriction endonuclease
MAAVSPRILIDAVLQAIEDSGCSGTFLNRKLREHPRRFAIALPDDACMLTWLYIWTLTPGGRTSLPDEYRIQMTTVTSPLPHNPQGPTILAGYEPDLRLFAGFALSRHRKFTEGSPSVQINIKTVRDALQMGLSFDRKSNDEIAVGVRPDHFVDYVQNAEALHRYGRFVDTFQLLTRATALEEIVEADVNALPEPRRTIVQTVKRLSRKGNFRQQVLTAYSNRCCVTRAQLRLVDAAHILPVGAPESSDDVRNGVALSPTYHRAYDAGLIYLDEELVMRINPAKVAELKQINLDGGLKRFESDLGSVIYLPPDRAQWPDPAFVRRANGYRNIRN